MDAGSADEADDNDLPRESISSPAGYKQRKNPQTINMKVIYAYYFSKHNKKLIGSFRRLDHCFSRQILTVGMRPLLIRVPVMMAPNHTGFPL